jgi:hypothetical protein
MEPLWSSVSTSVKWGWWDYFLLGLSWGLIEIVCEKCPGTGRCPINERQSSWGYSWAVECVLGIQDALGSIPNTIKTTKKPRMACSLPYLPTWYRPCHFFDKSKRISLPNPWLHVQPQSLLVSICPRDCFYIHISHTVTWLLEPPQHSAPPKPTSSSVLSMKHLHSLLGLCQIPFSTITRTTSQF